MKNAAWCRTPIDRFILAKMEAAGVTPNPQASRPQLIRRLYFDLIGLPPTPQEIAAFVTDPAPDAYEKLVDRLLANPHFGERWARHWLDLARFAESGGFEHDQDRPNAYLYRDFVIRAINDDLPYDTFVRWQLAGDEFEPENPLAMEATGFLAAGVHCTQITKSEVERHRYDEMDDMLATTGTAMLGLTIGCARCHDHKYDPIPQRDYYQMLSAFTTTVRSEVDLTENADQYRREKEKFDREHESFVSALRKYETEKLPARFADWEKSPHPANRPTDDGMWLVLEPSSLVSREKATFTRLDDGSWLASGANGRFDTYTFVAGTDLSGITGIRIEAMADPSMVRGGPGRASNGNFDLTDFRVTAVPTDEHSAKPANSAKKGAIRRTAKPRRRRSLFATRVRRSSNRACRFARRSTAIRIPAGPSIRSLATTKPPFMKRLRQSASPAEQCSLSRCNSTATISTASAGCASRSAAVRRRRNCSGRRSRSRSLRR